MPQQYDYSELLARESLKMWTLYDHPTDYPKGFIARLFVGTLPTDRVMTGADLGGLRRALRGLGLAVVPRSPEDDPTIIETWL